MVRLALANGGSVAFVACHLAAHEGEKKQDALPPRAANSNVPPQQEERSEPLSPSGGADLPDLPHACPMS